MKFIFIILAYSPRYAAEIIAKVLKEIKYSGIVTIESAPGYMFKCFGNEADERMIKTFRYWKEIIDSTVLN